MDEAIRAESLAENDLLKAKLLAAESAMEHWKNEAKNTETRSSIAIKAANAMANFAVESQKKAEARAIQAEMTLKSNTAYWKKVAERANLRAAAFSERKPSSCDAEEKVERAIKNAHTPFSKLKIMAAMVGVKPITMKDVTYRKLWKQVIMIVHQDKRPGNISKETSELYDCVCKTVNTLPSE